MWNLKKGHNELLCIRDTDSQTLKNLWFPNETCWGCGDALGVQDGNAIKFGCDDHCTTINVKKFIKKNCGSCSTIVFIGEKNPQCNIIKP